MSVRLIPAVAGLAMLSGCPSEVTDTTPPSVAEPAEGHVYDRALVRVRMSPPGDSIGPDGQVIAPTAGNDAIGHANWRVNHGYASEAIATSNTDVDHGFVFAATLVPGANLLELGRCNLADQCGWTGINVRVDLEPGSPDPAFAGTGIVTYPPNVRQDGATARGVWPLPDGRVLVAAYHAQSSGLLAFKADGTLDGSFGMYGTAQLPATLDGMHLVIEPNGYAAQMGDNLVRISPTGQVDTTLGANGLVQLTALGASGALDPLAFTADGTGGYWLAGVVPPRGSSTHEFVLHVDSTGAALAYQELGDGSAIAATVRPSGQAALLYPDRVQVVGGAAVSLPQAINFSQHGAVIFAQNGDVVVARPSPNGASPMVHRIAGSAIAWTIELPFTTTMTTSYPTDPGTPLLTEAADGSLYVTGPWQAPPDGQCCKWFPSSGPSVELGVVRIVGGAIDSTFGAAHAGSALAWIPMTTERTVDTPAAIALGPDGAPWVVGVGLTTDIDNGLYTVRGPGVVIARFKP